MYLFITTTRTNSDLFKVTPLKPLGNMSQTRELHTHMHIVTVYLSITTTRTNSELLNLNKTYWST